MLGHPFSSSARAVPEATATLPLPVVFLVSRSAALASLPISVFAHVALLLLFYARCRRTGRFIPASNRK